jgi:hypothetical protein
MTLRPLALVALVLPLLLIVPRVSLADPRAQLEGAVALFADYGKFERAAELQDAIDAIPDDQLQYVYGNSDLNGLIDQLDAALSASADIKEMTREIEARRTAARGRQPSQVVGKDPDPSDPSWPSANPPQGKHCSSYPDLQPGDTISNTEWDLAATSATVEGAQTILKGARDAWMGFARACEQVEGAIVLGEGAVFNLSLGCIPVDLIFTAVELLVNVAEASLKTGLIANRVNWYCNGAITGARVKANYGRLDGLKTIILDEFTGLEAQLDTDADEIDGNIELVRGELADLKADVDLRLAELQADMDTVLTILKGNGLSRYGGARWNDAYYRDGDAEKVAEACDLAQGALTYAKQTYQVGMRAQMLIDRGNKFISSETSPQLPHEGFEACRTAYRLATDKSYKLKN